MGDEETPDAIMQLGLSFWGAKTLLSAVELGVFTVTGISRGAGSICPRCGPSLSSTFAPRG
jgi:hypothetical protein